jgi:hypothetical protein
MIILRYFWWLQIYHFATFYRQTPWAFLIGVILMPYFVLSKFLQPSEIHDEMVVNGIRVLKSYWQISGAITPPKFVERRFLALESDITRSLGRDKD